MSEVLDRQTIKALGADARQDIMKLLAKRPHTASELAKITRKHVTTITEHLEVLEGSGLVRKKDSTNKWVYYTLTDKGEHLFKPQFYSWVIVFCLSAVFIFVGFLRMFQFGSVGFGSDSRSMEIAQKASKSPLAATTVESIESAAPVDYIAIILIILGVIGLIYLLYKKYKN